MALEAATIDLAYRHDLPLVATNEAFFLTRDDFDAHDALIAIAEGAVIAEDNRRRLTQDNYLQARSRNGGAFRRPARGDRQYGRDRPALRLCPKTRKPDPAALRRPRAADAMLPSRPRRRSWHGRRATGLTSGWRCTGWRRASREEDYRDRLEFELGVIEKMKYPGYFLIVADFIKWAKAQGIPVGPGRGSGAGSLVA